MDPRAACVAARVPSTFARSCARSPSKGCSSNGASSAGLSDAHCTALLTRTSTRPHRSTTEAIAPRIESSEARSKGTTIASVPKPRAVAATFSALSLLFRYVMAMRAPSCAKRMAVARPIPWELPVTRATRPLNPRSMPLGLLSPDLHAAIDHDVHPRHVRALAGGEEQRHARHLLRSAQAAQESLAEHVIRPFWVLQLLSSLIGFDHAWRNRVGANPVLSSLHGQLPCHPDDPGLRRRVGQRSEVLEAHQCREGCGVHDDAATALEVGPHRSREVEDQIDLVTTIAVPLLV